MNKPWLALIAALSFFAAQSASALDEGLYVGAGIGLSTLEVSDGDLDFDDDDFSWKIIGGWRFNDWLAIETGYNDFGKPEDSVLGVDVEADFSGIPAFGIASISLGPVVAFGKLGFLYWDGEISASGIVESFDDDGWDPAYGGGLGFELFGLQARFEVEYFDVDEIDDLWMASIGATYTF